MAGVYQTDFGPLPLPDDFIPRPLFARYIEAAKAEAQRAWVAGREYVPLPLSALDDLRI